MGHSPQKYTSSDKLVNEQNCTLIQKSVTDIKLLHVYNYFDLPLQRGACLHFHLFKTYLLEIGYKILINIKSELYLIPIIAYQRNVWPII